MQGFVTRFAYGSWDRIDTRFESVARKAAEEVTQWQVPKLLFRGSRRHFRVFGVGVRGSGFCWELQGQ